jgi:hypothetical protein
MQDARLPMDRVSVVLSKITTDSLCSNWAETIIATPSLHLVPRNVEIRACMDSSRPALSVGKQDGKGRLTRYRTFNTKTNPRDERCKVHSLSWRLENRKEQLEGCLTGTTISRGSYKLQTTPLISWTTTTPSPTPRRKKRLTVTCSAQQRWTTYQRCSR